MNTRAYQTLVNDTLTYIKGRLPEKASSIEIPPPPQPKPPPDPVPSPEVKTASPPSPPSSIEPAPLQKPTREPTERVRKIMKELDPELFLHEKIPSDFKAKRIKEAWKEQRVAPAIPILFQGTQYRRFVQNIAKAIDLTFGSCRIMEIEKGKKWDLFLKSPQLKLIIAPDTLIFGNKEILPFYQETPQQKSRKLGEVPLLLLPDLSLYYKDPYLKRALWNVLCNTINTLPSS